MAEGPTPIELTPIGAVHTPIETPEDAPRQGFHEAHEGTVVVEEPYRAGLDGVEPGRELALVWFADRADRSKLDTDREGRGAFTTRSPHRPNPVCVTTVTVLAVEDGRLHVRGVDMVDGSPLLDVKATVD